MQAITLMLVMQIFGGDQDPCGCKQDPCEFEKSRPEMQLRLWHNFSHTEVLDRDEIAGWSLAVPELLHFAADKGILGSDSERQGAGERALRSFAAIAPLIVIESSIAGASHEYGHFRADSMAGMNDFEFVNENDDSDRFNANPFNAFSTQLLTHWFGGDNYLATVGDWDDFSRDPNYLPFRTMMEAGGLNQNQYNAELMAEKMMNGRAHFLDSVTYFSNSLMTLLYPTGVENSDIDDYIDDLDRLGVKTSVKEIKFWSQLPKFVSNSTLSFLIGAMDYWVNGDKRVEPMRLAIGGGFQIYWPEFASYLTLFGPTVKVGERIGWEGQAFTIYFERSLSENVSEAGIGWKGRISDWLSAEAKILHNFGADGTWVEGGPVIRLFSWLSVGAKGYYGDGYTFHREIVGQVPSFLEEKEFGVKGFVEANIRY